MPSAALRARRNNRRASVSFSSNRARARCHRADERVVGAEVEVMQLAERVVGDVAEREHRRNTFRALVPTLGQHAAHLPACVFGDRDRVLGAAAHRPDRVHLPTDHRKPRGAVPRRPSPCSRTRPRSPGGPPRGLHRPCPRRHRPARVGAPRPGAGRSPGRVSAWRRAPGTPRSPSRPRRRRRPASRRALDDDRSTATTLNVAENRRPSCPSSCARQR